ncbi:MAG: hypothetical protein ACE5NG_02410 [bacterium]
MKRICLAVTLAWSLCLVVVISTIIHGCGSSATLRRNSTVGRISFDFNGRTYSIESVNPKSKSQLGYNLLVRREGQTILFKAVDKEQDGLLDELVIGDVSLEKAQEIYLEGLVAAETHGSIKKRDFPRVYRTSDELNRYELRTYILKLGEVYNKLTITKADGLKEEIVVLDLGADGTLDEIEKGQESLGHCQQLYSEVLDRGLKEKKVAKTDGMYHVVM